MRILLAIVALAATGCAGDETDVGKGAVCTGALYDDCASEHDCMSNDCRTYQGYNVCTQQCSATVPCPARDGVAVPCDGDICRPVAHRTFRVLP